MKITETKIIVVTRYSGEGALLRASQFIKERRTGDIHLHVTQGSVQVVEFSETKRQPVALDDVFGNGEKKVLDKALCGV